MGDTNEESPDFGNDGSIFEQTSNIPEESQNYLQLKNDRIRIQEQSIFYNQVQSNLDSLKIPINDDLKQIQVNTYYYKKYKSENHILYFINIILVIIIIISIIKKRFPFLDDLSYSIIIGIILGFSLLYIIYLLWNIINKDHQNYDEYYYDQYSYDYNENGSDISDNSNLSCLKPGKYLDLSYNINDLNDLLKLK
jgi:hypothetical protein